MIDQLVQLASIWADVSNRSVARLATLVANDGALFTRVERGAQVTTGTFEKFLLFFRDPVNWPEGVVPPEAAALLDNFGHIAVGDAGASGKADDLTVAGARAA